MRHLMIDIETLGTKPGSVITQIAAVQFDLKTGKLGETFNEKISIQSCLDLGLVVDAGAIEFWANEPSFKNLFINPKHLSEVLYLFRTFMQKLQPNDLQVWGNGLDLPVIEMAYDTTKQNVPWKYTMVRDVRTLVSFAPEIKENCKAISKFNNKHDALNDCYFQIEYCVKTYNKIMSKINFE